MANPADYIAPYIPTFMPVPAPGRGICTICRTAMPGVGLCASCTAAEAFHGPLPALLPIVMVTQQSALYHHLIGYKTPHDGASRTRSRMIVAATLAMFIRTHSTCIGDYDMVAVVPSPARHALRPVIELISGLRDNYRELLVASGPKSRVPAHRFVLADGISIAGQRVLLIEDTVASGMTLFSAADTLRRAGAEVVGPLVIGRLLKADWSAPLITTLRSKQWQAGECCRCHPLAL